MLRHVTSAIISSWFIFGWLTPSWLISSWLLIVSGGGLGASLLFPVASVLAAEPASPAAAEDTSSPAEPAAAIAGWIEQLGDESFARREAASDHLSRSGEAATPRLLEALRHPDPEVRRRVRAVLERLLETEHQRRLQAFIEDESGEQEHDLPGWKRFRELVGDSAKARELFIQMQKVEFALLASADAGADPAAEAIDLRLSQVQEQMKRGGGGENDNLATLAALLFVTADPQLDLPHELLDSTELMNVPTQAAIRAGLTKGPYKEVLRTLLGRWILRPTGPRLLQAKLRLALEQELTEGLALGIRSLRQQELPPNYRFFGVQSLAKLGGPEYAAYLLPLLEDQGECTRRVVRKEDGKIELISIQIRDVALGWLVHLTGQEHADYHMAHAKSAFERLKQRSNYNLSIISVYFAKEADRDDALKKWSAWVKEHPLPEPPALDEAAEGPALVAGSQVPNRFGIVQVPGGEKKEDETLQSAGLRRADRQLVRQLEQARQLVDQKDYGEAALLLGNVLVTTRAQKDIEFGYQPERLSPLWRALGAEAEWLLGNLPPAGLEAYELQFGAEARRQLEDGLSRRDPAALHAVTAQFLHTDAGREATYLLGSYYYDQSQPLRGALVLQRLHGQPKTRGLEPDLSIKLAACWLLANQPDRAEQVLRSLPADRGGVVNLGDRKIEWFEEADDALAWLAGLIGRQVSDRGYRWPVPGGDSTRNRQGANLQPYLSGRAVRDLGPTDEIQRILQQLEQQQLEEFTATLPSGSPLLVEGTLLLRTATELQAVDPQSGTPRWRAPLDDSLNHLLAADPPADLEDRKRYLREGLQRRLWENPTYGTISSNGRLVFALEGLAFGKRGDYQRLVVMPDGRRRLDPDGVKSYNRISAFELGSGKLAWEAGGPQSRTSQPLAGTYFLGPPLPLGNQLFVVGLQDKQTHLFELAADTGELVWQRPLADPTPDGPSRQVRQWTPPLDDLPSLRGGQSPSYAEGVLVCPTDGNTYVAVDPALRQVLWSFEAPQSRRIPRGLMVVNAQQRQLYDLAARQSGQGWAESPIIIAQGKVLLTPIETDALYCLDLRTGEVVWKAARRDGLYLAGVNPDGTVLVVGRGGFWGLRSDNGQPAWQPTIIPLPPGALPSGRGYLADRFYYVPLTTREVAVMDVRRGVLMSRTGSPDRTLPGNLVPGSDAILSQNATGLWKFDTLEQRAGLLVERLRENPQDAAALAERGELALYQGRLEQASADLRAAYRIKPRKEYLRLLTEAVLEGIRTDFRKYQPLSDEIKPLLGSGDDALRFTRQLALAYRQAGEFAEALEQYIKLLPRGGDAPEMEFVAAGHRVRGDRWLRARLSELYATANEDQQEWLAQRARQLQSELGDEQILDYFGFLPEANRIRLELAEAHRRQGQPLKAEYLLRQALDWGPPEQQPHALARLAALLREANRPQEAARIHAALRDQWGDAECLPGMTGKQIVDKLDPESEVARLLMHGDPWPSKHVQVKSGSGNSQVNVGYPVAITRSHPLDPRLHFQVNTQGQALMAADDWGRRNWSIDLGKLESQWGHSSNMFSYSEGRLWGHLLTVWLGNRVVAVDAFSDKGKPLWSHATLTTTPPQPRMLQPVALRLRMPRVPQAFGSGQARPLAVGGGVACFIQDNELTAVDLWDGSLVWKRRGFGDGTDLLTDGRLLLATLPGQTDCRVLSLEDGSEVASCEVPAMDQRLAVHGRRIVTWETTREGSLLTLHDPLHGSTVWKRSFSPEAAPAVVGGDQVLVLEPAGHLVLMDIDTGQALWETRLPEVKSVDELFALRSDSRYLLIVNTPPDDDEPPANQIIGFGMGMGAINVEGSVLALASDDGRTLWTRRIHGQSLTLDQPAEVPVLTFLNHVRSVENNRVRMESNMLCIDPRTGRTLHEQKTTGYNNTFDQLVDRANRKVEVRSRRFTVTLRFTDKPIVEAPAEKPDDKTDDKTDKAADAKEAAKPAETAEQKNATEQKDH